MREILFRGKMDNGEWMYGSFCMDALEQFNGLCGVDGFIRLYDKAKGKMQTYEVDRETVGQYTGLTDKNGKRIFEGDIVHCLARMDEANCVVIFEEGEFRLVPERNYKTYVTGGGYHALRCFVKEVIGNIHDNQELLKGGEG